MVPTPELRGSPPKLDGGFGRETGPTGLPPAPAPRFERGEGRPTEREREVLGRGGEGTVVVFAYETGIVGPGDA
jgi:hypothetical protein